MPISVETAKVTVDFEYIWETPNETVTYNMRLQHEEEGPVILIFNGGNEPVVLPASMFGEVAEFLVRQGAIRGITTPLSVGGKSVAMPTITRKPKEEITPRHLGNRVPKVENTVEPVASFSPTSHVDETTDQDEPEVKPEHVEGSAELTNDVTASIAERMRTRANVNVEKLKEKRIKQR